MNPQNQQDYINLLTKLLEATKDSDDNFDIVNSLLTENLEKVDENFLQVFQIWVKEKLAEAQTDEAESIARNVFNFCKAIHTFSWKKLAIGFEIAITGYQEILLIFTHDAYPEDWAKVKNHLGNSYRNRIEGDKAENLELAIQAYQEALLVRTPKAFPKYWADTQYNLGNTYFERIKGDKTENLEMSIEAFQNALTVYNYDSFPNDWAGVQCLLSIAYFYRIRGDKGENLELAITALENALTVYTRDAFPEYWAATLQAVLGIFYSDRIRGYKGENLELAIKAYENALTVHTHDAFPQDWAGIQNNLGNAYSHRIRGDKGENLELAITAYKNTLTVCTRDAFPNKWANTQYNLGNAYSHRIRGDKGENLELAITACENALTVHTRDTFPQDWARIQNSLGNHYIDRIREDKGENLELAITTFENALTVRTRNAFPQDWALTQNNLGNAYNKRIRGDKGENTRQAIACYKEALSFYSSTTLPIDTLRTGRNLGNLAFKEGLWETAIEGYEQAIAAVELSRSWITNDTRRQEIIQQDIYIYFNLVQACVNTKQYEKAIKYVESSRSRLMVDLMASNDLYNQGEIPEEIKEYLQQYETFQKQIDEESNDLESDNREKIGTRTTYRSRVELEKQTEKIKALEIEKQKVWRKIRTFDPVLAGQIQIDSLDFDAIQKLIKQPNTAILSFYTTQYDTYIFVIRQNQITIHINNGQGKKELQDWIYQKWLLPYLPVDKETRKERIKRVNAWYEAMTPTLTELSQRLQLDSLIKEHLKNIKEIIIIPHINLHQIPFAALPTEEGLFGDRFLIRYAPSCQILKYCDERESLEFNQKSLEYGIVEDATDDLDFTKFECEKIAQMLPNHQRLQGSLQATVDNYRRLVRQINGLHSSHHASSRWDNPLESRLYLGDGSITLGEIMSPGWRLPQLSEVFLSCCETNFGKSEITDDVLTLSAGFLCAGARSVINTLWSVDDLATSLFSIFYYQWRQSGYSRIKSVQKSQHQLRNLSGEELKNQYSDELNQMLEVKKTQAGIERRNIKKLEPQTKGTPEYEEWKKKYKQIADIEIKISDSRNRLNDLSKLSLPFEHPRYWAAFCCHGMG